jgi:hypothetical protein
MNQSHENETGMVQSQSNEAKNDGNNEEEGSRLISIT